MHPKYYPHEVCSLWEDLQLVSLFLCILRTSHLSGLNSIDHSVSQSSILCQSSWRLCADACDFIVRLTMRVTTLPPLRTAYYPNLALHTAILGLAYCVPFNNKKTTIYIKKIKWQYISCMYVQSFLKTLALACFFVFPRFWPPKINV